MSFRFAHPITLEFPMHFLRFLLAALACMTLAPSVQAEEAPQALLLGKWRHSTLVRVIDGKTLAPQQFDGSTTLEFKPDQTWQLISNSNRSGGTYRWLNANELEASVLESGVAMQVGMVSVKRVRVDRERLTLITVHTEEEDAKYLPPPKPGVHRPKETVVISTFNRRAGE